MTSTEEKKAARKHVATNLQRLYNEKYYTPFWRMSDEDWREQFLRVVDNVRTELEKRGS